MTAPPVAVILASGYWDTQTGAPDVAPGAGKYRADSWASPTLVALASTDKDGYDRHAGLVSIQPGDAVIQQGPADSQDFQQWTVTKVTDQGTWVQLAVGVAATGTAFAAPGSNQSRLVQALQVAPPAGPPDTGGASWESWAPPLDPPTAGGLPYAQAQAIADLWWAAEPHLCAALQWEAYAATLAPTPAVASVSTGAQSVAYSPAAPTGSYGLAIQRAEWHRSFLASELLTAPMVKAPPYYTDPVGYMPWWTVDQVPPP